MRKRSEQKGRMIMGSSCCHASWQRCGYPALAYTNTNVADRPMSCRFCGYSNGVGTDWRRSFLRGGILRKKRQTGHGRHVTGVSLRRYPPIVARHLTGPPTPRSSGYSSTTRPGSWRRSPPESRIDLHGVDAYPGRRLGHRIEQRGDGIRAYTTRRQQRV